MAHHPIFEFLYTLVQLAILGTVMFFVSRAVVGFLQRRRESRRVARMKEVAAMVAATKKRSRSLA